MKELLKEVHEYLWGVWSAPGYALLISHLIVAIVAAALI